jgi:hypothetical protein
MLIFKTETNKRPTNRGKIRGKIRDEVQDDTGVPTNITLLGCSRDKKTSIGFATNRGRLSP